MNVIKSFLSLFFIYKDVDYTEYLNKSPFHERLHDCFAKTGQSLFYMLGECERSQQFKRIL